MMKHEEIKQIHSFTVMEFLIAMFLDFLGMLMAVILALVAYDSLIGNLRYSVLAIPMFVWYTVFILIVVMIIMAITWIFAMIFTFRDLRKHKS